MSDSAKTATPAETADVPALATYPQRFGALLVDWVLCLLLTKGLLAGGLLPHFAFSELWTNAVAIVEYTAFLTFLTQTPGMRLAKIHCVHIPSSGPLGFGRALLRAVLLLGIFLPALTAFSDPHRRGLHDKATGSAMVR